MIRISLFLLAACAANLDVEDSDIGKIIEPEDPPTLGVNKEDDCDQATIGSKVCNLVLQDQSNNFWKLYDHAGKIIILDFSTVWCGPCQTAGHYTQGIQDDYGDKIIFATILIEGMEGLPATLEDVQIFVTRF